MSDQVVHQTSAGGGEAGPGAAPQPMAPKYRAWPTYAIIALNVLVFGVMVAQGVNPMQPTVDSIIQWGGNFGPRTTHGEFWRVFTSMFLHFGVIHLGMNMLVLAQIGPIVERLVGRRGMVAIYLAAGLGGSLLRLAVNPMVCSAGASGAVFGLYGGLFAFVARHRKTLDPQVKQGLMRSAGTFVMYNVVYGAALANVDMAAHIGGLAAGFLGGLIVAAPQREGRSVRGLAVVGLALAGTVAAAFTLPPAFDFLGEAKKLDVVEKSTLPKAQELLKSAGNRNDPAIAATLERDVIPPWEEAARAWQKARRLPKELRPSADAIARYIDARIAYFKALAAYERTGDETTGAEVEKKGRAVAATMKEIEALNTAATQKR